VREDLLDHRLVQDRRDDLQLTAAVRAMLPLVRNMRGDARPRELAMIMITSRIA
jgi:hypothetical protein